MVAGQLAAVREKSARVGRASWLGVLLMALARKLSAARREIAGSRRENAALRSRVDAGEWHVSGTERHQRAVAQTLGFAQEAAAREDFKGALHWLEVVEVVGGVFPVEWLRTRAVCRRGESSATCADIARDNRRTSCGAPVAHATLEPVVQRGNLRRAIECQ